MLSHLGRALGIALLAVVAAKEPAWPGAPVPPDEAREIATDAYIYAYPLVLMELTRRTMANTTGARGEELMNQFDHLTTFPDPKFTDVVRPNADTLYSQLFYDVAHEPLIIGVPDSEGRYYLLPILDMWTDIFSSSGSRTTGTEAQHYAIVGPHWTGVLPKGIQEIRSPTAVGWMIGRTQTNGPSDYAEVNRFQHALSATPLSQWGKPHTVKAGKVNPAWDTKSPPVEQIEKLDASAFFSLFGELTKANPPHANDYPILERMQRIGIEPGKSFAMERLTAERKAAIADALPAARARIKEAFKKSGVLNNGWRTNLTAIGTYGTDYLHRAGVAYAGLGANTIEDAIYPTALSDTDGNPFDSAKRYVLHFDKDRIPPVRGFWSLTMYNDKQLFAENPINRYAIGDRDKLKLNADGSLDIYIQRDKPGADKESNWLPAPASGPFTMNLRLYWPKTEALDGTWTPPGVRPEEGTVGRGG